MFINYTFICNFITLNHKGYLSIFNSPMNPCDQSTKVVLLTAPVKPVTINMGMKMTSWYDIKGFKTDGDIEKVKKN